MTGNFLCMLRIWQFGNLLTGDDATVATAVLFDIHPVLFHLLLLMEGQNSLWGNTFISSKYSYFQCYLYIYIKKKIKAVSFILKDKINKCGLKGDSALATEVVLLEVCFLAVEWIGWVF